MARTSTARCHASIGRLCNSLAAFLLLFLVLVFVIAISITTLFMLRAFVLMTAGNSVVTSSGIGFGGSGPDVGVLPTLRM